MAEYIDKAAAIKLLTSFGLEVSDSKRRAIAKCISKIEFMPAADVEPVRHGQWKMVGANKRQKGGVWVCTACNKSPCCPNCGAQMDLREENEVERLTEYQVVGGQVHKDSTLDINQAMMRLAAYESEIHYLLGEWNAKMSVLNSIGNSELAEADNDGRVVILPCKVGDTVWILQQRSDGSDCVRAAEFWWSDIPQVGKTVFLSREEAEKALEEKGKETIMG